MNKRLGKSIVITGPSVTGKTTLCRRLMVHFGLEPVPVEMTREMRNGEIENVDGIFITEKEFKTRFENGKYLQKSIESAFFSGYYSGCPTKWIELTEAGDYRCFVCPTVAQAKELKKTLGEKIFWIHLTADEKTREERLSRRDQNIDKREFAVRIERGNSKVDNNDSDLIIDTSNLNAWEIFFHALVRI
jgi:guanylate kinase